MAAFSSEIHLDIRSLSISTGVPSLFLRPNCTGHGVSASIKAKPSVCTYDGGQGSAIAIEVIADNVELCLPLGTLVEIEYNEAKDPDLSLMP